MTLLMARPCKDIIPSMRESQYPSIERRDKDFRFKCTEYANAKRNACGHRLQVGTQVLRKNEHRRKTDSLWDPMPWSVTSVSGNEVSLQRQGESARRHASFVKPIPDVSHLGNALPDSVHVTRSTPDAVSVQNVSRNVHVDCAMQNSSNSLANAGGGGGGGTLYFSSQSNTDKMPN